ncbi:MAG: hypothetical protein U0132_24155 [Gemmatimonadaceae bacterium]
MLGRVLVMFTWRSLGDRALLVSLITILVMGLGVSPTLPPQAYALLGPDVSIGKGHFGAFYVGSPFAIYTFHVANGASSGPTTGPIALTDTLPTGITYNSVYSQTGGWSCTASGQTFTCTTPGPLEAGSYVTVHIMVDIAVPALGQRSNTAAVTTDGDTNLSNNTSPTDTVTVTATPGPPDLSIGKSHSGSFYVGSSTARYSFTVFDVNGGPTTGTITLTDTLPTGMTYDTVTSQSGGWGCSATGQNVTCTNAGPIPSGGHSLLTIAMTIAAGAVGDRSNTATVATPGDTNIANNTSPTDTVTVTPSVAPPDLTVGKSHSGSFVVGSTNALYTLNVTNVAGGPTTGTITVSDTLPTGITYLSIDSQLSGWGCSASGQTVTCTNAGPLAPGSYTWVTIRVDIAASAVGQRANTATVTTPGDSNASNNTSRTDYVTIPPQTFSLTVTRNGSGSGTVTSSPGGITCGSDCSETYTSSTVITLTATATAGSTFVGWSGDCGGVGMCQVTMNGARAVNAQFQRNNVDVSVVPMPGVPPSSPQLQATLTARAGCGPIDHIQFGVTGHSLDNARVSITAPAGGPIGQTSGFTYTPPAGTTSVTLTIQRVVPSGGATVNPVHFWDGCGDWVTFVGGGPNAFH